MFKFNDDYLTRIVPQTLSEELYYWEDVVRVAYYIHVQWGYDNRQHRQTYLVVQHACGEYLKISKESEDWKPFEDNMDKYLSIQVKVKDRKKLLENNPPLESLIDLYVKG